ncbi:hypothetical protein SK128_018970 [Halocaridina rubra]|uniref:Uncharacterized protein n=1 Tax=Halocaridina rubra TaxID=373956 RepID=A0AAN9A795_HALRR
MAGLEGELMLSSAYEGEEQQSDNVEGFVEVTSKAEKKRDATRLGEDSDNGEVNTPKKKTCAVQEEGSNGMLDQQQDKQWRDQQEGDHRYAATLRYDGSCRSRRKSGAGSVPGSAVVSSLSDSDTEDENDPQAAGNSGGGGITACWTEGRLLLCYSHHGFPPETHEGRYSPYITVKDRHAVDFLTTKGFEGTVLEMPDWREKYTKEITFDVPTYLSPEDLDFDDRFMWIKRREVKIKGKFEHKPKLIALMPGSVPENVFIPCLGYKYVSVYNEPPVLCYKCSRWGHMQYKVAMTTNVGSVAGDTIPRNVWKSLRKMSRLFPVVVTMVRNIKLTRGCVRKISRKTQKPHKYRG